MKKCVLSIEHLKKNYHDKNGEIVAIKDVSFDVYDGEFLSIVGPSGCGKSTLLSILAKIDEKSEGEINCHSDNIILGYMLQSDFLFPWRTILENCLLGLEINKTLDEKKKQRVIELLNTYGLGDFINKYPDSLSGGMKQRVGWMLCRHKVIIKEETYNQNKTLIVVVAIRVFSISLLFDYKS